MGVSRRDLVSSPRGLSTLGRRIFDRCTFDVDEIGRTLNRDSRTVHHVCVDHRRTYILVAEQLLHSPDVSTILQEMRRETVAQRIHTLPTNSARRRSFIDIIRSSNTM